MRKGDLMNGLIRMVLVVAAFGAHAAAEPTSRPAYITDRNNRIVIYHGLNVCNAAKAAKDFLPWHTREDFARMRDWGFNLVRYLVFWEAIEPREGFYDDQYIAATIERFKWLNDLGIDVLVDVHQDLYARRFTGNGFPSWTINDGGRPFKPRQPWNTIYFEPAVRAAYDNFWKSDRLKAKYIAMLKYVMGKVDRLPNVIGIDVMNEPFSPNNNFEAEVLGPFYEDVQAMRRKSGFKIRLFFEPMMYTSAGLPTQLRFKPDPDCVYAPHFYDALCHEGLPYGPTNRELMKASVRRKAAEAVAFGTPMLFGEFGISTQVQNYGAYLDDFLRLLNTYHVGWTYYSYDKAPAEAFGVLDDEGRSDAKLKHLVMVYPQRIAGRNPDLRYEDRRFTLEYDPIECSLPTVIFVPRRLKGLSVTINDEPAGFDPKLLSVRHRNRSLTQRQTIRVEWK